jgi:glutamyl/glutaminyl-tRNA synthetase
MLSTYSSNFYACSCSRSQIQAVSGSIYLGTCRLKHLDKLNTDYSLRAVTTSDKISFHDRRLGDQNISFAETSGDYVVRRKGGLPSYHLVSVVDDVREKISLIVRGEDLLTSTATQLHLSTLIGLEFDNIEWIHHPLLQGDGGRKLSKSDDSLSLKDLRHTGTSAEEVYEGFTQWIGFKDTKIRRFSELLEHTTEKGIKGIQL